MRRNLSREPDGPGPGAGENGPVRYAILGTTQAIRDDGTPVAVGGARLRALLTALALRPGRAVPVRALVAEVWDGDPPADAVAALQALVARLRRALGRAAVRYEGSGYALAASREDVDLYRFEALVRAAAATDSASAGALYDEALALWRGPALADLPDRAAESARWEALRLEARRGRLAAALDLGQAEAALPELTALCAGQPLDEPLQALRIRALRDAGRPAEALAAYEGVRRDLAARLGTNPGPTLQSLHTNLLTPPKPPPAPSRLGTGATGTGPGLGTGSGPGPGTGSGPGPSTGSGPGTGASPSPGTGPGPARFRAGFGWDGAAVHAEEAALVPPGQGTGGGPAGWGGAEAHAGAGGSVPPGQGNLRARLTTFVGREEDIRVIGADLARARLVTLLGPGGAGKTRLSQEAAEAQDAGGWPDGVWLVELAPVDDPEDVAEAVLAALGARETKLRAAAAEELRALTDRGGDDPLDRLVDHCARRGLLLLLDNCEHVIGAAAELAERLLTHCPGVRILATSREPLGVPGETLRPVEPLPDPVALRLLADRGASARPGFTPDEDPAACAEICRRLDGLPLAIELAAARLRLLTPRQIADRLDDRFRLLTSGARTVLPRQQTLRAVVDWSWDLLTAPERTVLRRLSVFAGGCDLAAAETVCGDGTGLDVADSLGSLVDKSLVVAAPGPDGSGMRYRLLETVGEYAAERLAEAGRDREDTERRHLVHYRELARTSEPLLRGHGQRAATDRLATEYENVRTALRRAVAARDVDEVLCLIHSLGWYWHMHDLRAESRHWTEAAAALGPDPFAPPVVPAEPVYERLVDTPPPYSEELLAEGWRGIHLVRLAARDQTNENWNSPEVRARVDGALATYRPGLPQTCRTPASVWIYAVMIAGDAGLLQLVLDETVDTARALGYRWELACALQLRANVLANRADWAGDASRDADESLALFRELGDAWGCAEALSARAESREKRGEYGLATRDFREAIAYAERLGAKAQVTVLRVRMAGTLAENGEMEEAEEILAAIVATAHRFSNEAMPAARMFYAGILGRTGRIPQARAQIDLLRKEFAFGAFAIFDGFLLGTLAWLDNREGAYEEALARLRRATGTAQDPLARMVAPQMPAVYLLTAAVSLASLGGPRRVRDAVRLLGAHRAQLPPGHFPVTAEREDHALAEKLTRAALDDAAYEAAYAEGGGLTLEEATALI
ncbi:winged helix-turn-helix domain-containing protein [Streptomyces sp. APSN-46.1]|uniref:AfsR/SARP family transcriptional regulator n=1 Tax=Streptomyces sp. APSN-46.1 TaxID=2929049 RepID=UPI001FB37130|nr:BTAD domain-containing putative transcriptional regulator [Streptomyces sp. APSN-46.1]MCJ1677614.1 winged helix-turn-helix domain-containing protein [Streptomyces sp. APSN-46.1]